MKKLYRMFILLVVMALLAACSSQGGKEVYKDNDELIDSNDELYPAYVYKDNDKNWGYINSKGEFVIEPQYRLASDFVSYGLAIIEIEGKYGVINTKGEYVLKPLYEYILGIEDEVIVAIREYGSYVFSDLNGKELGEIKGFVGGFSEGLALYAESLDWGNQKYGYIDTKGNVVIEPKFLSGGSFIDGKAVVKVAEGISAVIDTTGKPINTIYENIYGDISEGIIIYGDYANAKLGYMTIEGIKLTEAVFNDARPFNNSYAQVMTEDGNGKVLWGLVNKEGNFVVLPQYGGIEEIDEGLYSVYNSIDDFDWMAHDFSPKAVINLEGRLLTDFSYYKVGKLDQGLYYVSDGVKTYFVDKLFNPIKNRPILDGFGEIKASEDILKVELDNELLYLTKEGKELWKSSYSYALSNGANVISKRYRPSRFILINYPQVNGLKDNTVEKRINDELERIFVIRQEDNENVDEYYETTDIGFEINELGELITFVENGYWYPIGAAHGSPWSTSHHFNIKTGRIYSLGDLFIDGSKYKARLEEIIKEKMKENKEEFFDLDMSEPKIADNQFFLLTAKGLEIRFQVYEIASYASGMPSFEISYEELEGILNVKGDLWQSIAAKVSR